jgi:hypothetical protein
MSQRPPHTLEVHVSFEANRLAPVHLTDAYELLVPTVLERKPATAELMLAPSLQKQAPEKKVV